MLQLNQKHIVIGLPLELSWNFNIKQRFCLLYFPRESRLFFWKNWSIVASKGNKALVTHDSSWITDNQKICISLFYIKWFRLRTLEQLDFSLNSTFVNFKNMDLKLPELEVPLQAIPELKPKKLDLIINKLPFSSRLNTPEIKSNNLRLKAMQFEDFQKLK